MLEMEDAGWDVEDVACPVDDMKATDRSRSFVQREESGEGDGGKVGQRFKVRIDGGVHDADNTWRVPIASGRLVEALRHYWVQARSGLFCEENSTVKY